MRGERRKKDLVDKKVHLAEKGRKEKDGNEQSRKAHTRRAAREKQACT